jgi:hypothetical protein
MRTFHTQSNVYGVSLEGSAGAIGRVHPSCEPVHAVGCVNLHNHKTDNPSFKLDSVHDVMTKGLHDGLVYYRRQIEGLSTSQAIVRELLCSAQTSPLRTSQVEVSSKRKFFLEALDSIFNQKLKGFPLFGYGHESPMKLHLKVQGRRNTQLLHPVSLLTQPAFRSVYLTLGLNEDVESRICEESVSEILNLMLSTRKNEECLRDLFTQIKDRAEQAKIPFKEANPQSPKFFKNLKFKIFNSINQRIPRPWPEVPV